MDESSAQLQKVKSIFQQAIDLDSADEREAFLDKACAGFEKTRMEVESLLAEHDLAHAFLETPARLPVDHSVHSDVARTISDAMSWLPADRTIDGRYHVEGVIAIGGMGVVYEATQTRPRRKVALKVMQRGLVSRRVQRRFQYESETLARLHHAHIAQVYEAGVHYFKSARIDADAMPYFAMEFIESALSITEFAESYDFSTRERVKLFVDACSAIQHGHQRGIIHRDIKPANLLVDAEGCVKVIDFGVARITDADIAVTTMQTGVGEIVGTVQYMSPEQCVGDPHDIDVRSDVYSLGLVLYELLTKELPYDLSGKSILGAVKLIQEQVPRRMSSINRRLRGDLEIVVEAAINKDPVMRYQSVSELQEDLRCYLDNAPVKARRPNAWILATRWMGRHPIVTTSLASFFCAIAIMAVMLGWVFYRWTRPSELRFAKDRRSAQLVNFLGEHLVKFGSESGPPNNVQAQIVGRPDRLGGGRVVLFSVKQGEHSTGQQLWLCSIDEFSRPIWQTEPLSGMEPPVIPDYWEVELSVDKFLIHTFFVADVFNDLPGDEIVVIHAQRNSSPHVVRVYDFGGSVLFESWHLGYIRTAFWVPEATLLVCYGDRHLRNEVEDHGYPNPPPWPAVTFALRPVVGGRTGWVNAHAWPVSLGKDPSLDEYLAWYKLLLPPTLAGDFECDESTARFDRGGELQIEANYVSENDRWSFSLLIDPASGEVSEHLLDDRATQAVVNGLLPSPFEPRLVDWPPPVDARDH